MARLVGYFFVVLVVLWILRLTLGWVPLLGPLLSVPFLGFWIAAIVVSVVASKVTMHAVDRRRTQSLMRQLGAVETPHNQGKLGSLLLGQGRSGKALPLLKAAAEGEPEVAEWQFRYGQALLAKGEHAEASVALERVLALDEEHAYGSAMLAAAQALLESGDAETSLQRAERFERNHGPSPESAYRRALALKALGRRADARDALNDVGKHVASQAKYQRQAGAAWQLRAFFARLST